MNMKIKELITKLNAFNPELEIGIETGDGLADIEDLGIYSYAGDKLLLIRTDWTDLKP